jgi:MFS family permease
MAQFAVNTYVSTYMEYLGTGAVLTGVIAGLYYAVSFALRPISGPTITVVNKKTLMIIVYAAGAVINLGYAFFPSVPMFVLMRFLHGVQLAFYGSLALTVASDSLPDDKMASGLGIYGLSGIVAQALGPSVAAYVREIGTNLMGESGGFMAIFLTAAFFAAVSVIPCVLLPDMKITAAERKSVGVWYENIIAKPAIVPSLVVMLLSMAAILYNTYMIPYGEWKNISNVSLYFTVTAAVTVLARPLAGKLTDKYGSAKVFFPGVIIYLCSFIFISCATDLSFIIIGAIFAAFGFGAILPAVQTMVIQSVPPIKRGAASNTNFFGIDLGNFLGPTLSGFILAHYSYVTMYRLAMIPVIIATIVFALGWKPYLRQREKLKMQETK